MRKTGFNIEQLIDFNFDALSLQIENATKKAFAEMVGKYKEQNIYALALYSDQGSMTVCPAINTQEFLQSLNVKNSLYYKYKPSEWSFQGKGADREFSQICNELFDEVESEKYDMDTDTAGKLFEIFQSRLYQCCVDVLAKLKKKTSLKQ